MSATKFNTIYFNFEILHIIGLNVIESILNTTVDN